jgi:hypothetical protein
LAGDEVSIIYVGGAGRSGSTVLAHLLANAYGGVAVGELKDIWRRGPIDNQLCNCGKPFMKCEFWMEVGEEAFGGWDTLPLQDLSALQARIDRFRTLPRLLKPDAARRFDPEFSSAVDTYRATLADMYRAIRKVSGTSRIVEASKHPAQALILGGSASLRPRVVHLVRDSRGVAWSLQKRVVRPEITARRRLMPRASAGKAALEWGMFNLPFHLFTLEGRRPLLVKYEDYIRSPEQTLERVAEYLEFDRHLWSRGQGESSGVDFAGSHSFGGNPVRFDRGVVSLRLDEEWKRAMDPGARIVVSMLTLPLLMHYGYLL